MNRKADTGQVALMLETFAVAETARRLGMSARQISRIKKELSLTMRPVIKRQDGTIERKMVKLHRKRGDSLRNIGSRFGLSHEQVRLITEEA